MSELCESLQLNKALTICRDMKPGPTLHKEAPLSWLLIMRQRTRQTQVHQTTQGADKLWSLKTSCLLTQVNYNEKYILG